MLCMILYLLHVVIDSCSIITINPLQAARWDGKHPSCAGESRLPHLAHDRFRRAAFVLSYALSAWMRVCRSLGWVSRIGRRSQEHTLELQSLIPHPPAVLCLKKNNT